MINIGRHYFACDECPICEGVDYRLRIAKELDSEPQFEYCGCDKVQTEFLFSGHCEDAYLQIPRFKKAGIRKTGLAYRREMKGKHKAKMMRLLSYGHYKPTVAYVDWDYVDGHFQRVGKYIKYPKNSNADAIGNGIPIESSERETRSIAEISIGSVLITGGRYTKGGISWNGLSLMRSCPKKKRES